MDYIVLDLEWNQGETVEDQELTGLPFEIVEIGAVKLDGNRRVVDRFSSLIRPRVYRRIHRYTGEIIHLTMDQLDREGRDFPEVCQDLLDFCGTSPVFCTWGPLDLTELQRNMDYYDMEPLVSEGPLPFLDVQKLYSLAFEDGRQRKSLEHASEEMKLTMDLPFHRALSDAEYTARIFSMIPERLLRNVSFDNHVTPRDAAHEVHIVFDTYSKFISREFETKEAAMGDKEVMSTKCYLCHRNLRRKIKWFPATDRYHLAVSVCNTHGYMQSKLRLRKAEDGGYYAVKTSKFITQEKFDEIKRKQEKHNRRNKHGRKSVEE